MKTYQVYCIYVISSIIFLFNVIYLGMGILGQMGVVILIGGLNLLFNIWNALVFIFLHSKYRKLQYRIRRESMGNYCSIPSLTK